MSEKSIKKNFSLSLAYQILTLITPFVTTPYISRVLEPDGVGITSYTASVVAMFALFAYLGVMSYGTIEIAKVRDNFERRNQLFWEIELMVIISSERTMPSPLQSWHLSFTMRPSPPQWGHTLCVCICPSIVLLTSVTTPRP